MSDPVSLAEALPEAIKRAQAVRDQFIEIREMKMSNVIVAPQIALITHEIDAAVAALASGDVVAQLRAYEAIKGYEP